MLTCKLKHANITWRHFHIPVLALSQKNGIKEIWKIQIEAMQKYLQEKKKNEKKTTPLQNKAQALCQAKQMLI